MEYKVIVRVTGGKDCLGIEDQDFTWTGDNQEDLFGWATNFAEGYTTALMSGDEGIRLWHPLVKPIDGYRWWMRHNDFKVEVVNKDGKFIRKPGDIIAD